MIDRILETYKTSTYDFRAYACSQDPLIDRFEEWVNYYRLKWAIARILMPASILEIGVRYGYSARAFLDANPHTQLVGIDADLLTFGGQPGALDWAEKSLRNFDVSFYRENTQILGRLPGDTYDLIHIDGQQDGDGTFHDLDLALKQARHILVDGYFWSRENFPATNEWLWLNKAAIESVLDIPGYAGEFLIRTKLGEGCNAHVNVDSSLSLAQTYTSDYYLNDCGGYIQWRRSKGQIVDPRLQAVADVGMVFGIPTKVADLGAGRGELARIFAQQGAQVTAIDYSTDAVQMIEKTLESEERSVRQRVHIICDSVLNSNVYDGDYDLAVASDLVEHLSPAEDAALYELISYKLKPNKGALVIHTAPNLWFYNYEHPRQQKSAKRAGFWLPHTRRTWYERLMHINEQNPRVLKQQLSHCFPHVLVWFADNQSMGGSLLRNFRIADLRRATSLFAVAAHLPIDQERFANAFRMMPLSMKEAATITLHLVKIPERVWSNQLFTVSVTLDNPTEKRLASLMPYPLHLSYHWINETGNPVVFDGIRSRLYPPLIAHRQATYDMQIKAPDKPGRYTLRLRPVQEMVRWHEKANLDSDPIVIIENTELA